MLIAKACLCRGYLWWLFAPQLSFDPSAIDRRPKTYTCARISATACRERSAAGNRSQQHRKLCGCGRPLRVPLTKGRTAPWLHHKEVIQQAKLQARHHTLSHNLQTKGMNSNSSRVTEMSRLWISNLLPQHQLGRKSERTLDKPMNSVWEAMREQADLSRLDKIIQRRQQRLMVRVTHPKPSKPATLQLDKHRLDMVRIWVLLLWHLPAMVSLRSRLLWADIKLRTRAIQRPELLVCRAQRPCLGSTINSVRWA